MLLALIKDTSSRTQDAASARVVFAKKKLVRPARYSKRSPDLGKLGPRAKTAAWHTGF
jgi:hypothetical protein